MYTAASISGDGAVTAEADSAEPQVQCSALVHAKANPPTAHPNYPISFCFDPACMLCPASGVLHVMRQHMC